MGGCPKFYSSSVIWCTHVWTGVSQGTHVRIQWLEKKKNPALTLLPRNRAGKTVASGVFTSKRWINRISSLHQPKDAAFGFRSKHCFISQTCSKKILLNIFQKIRRRKSVFPIKCSMHEHRKVSFEIFFFFFCLLIHIPLANTCQEL